MLNLEALSIAVSTYHCVAIYSYRHTLLYGVAEFNQWCDGFDFIEFSVLAAKSISDNKNNLPVKDFVLEFSHIC